MCPNPQFPADLVTFTEEILNGKLHFLCSVRLEMMGQTSDLDTAEQQEIPIKVCVIFYNIEIYYRGCVENKASFLVIA